MDGDRADLYDRIIDRLSLPYRFTTRDLCDAISLHRGKAIKVAPLAVDVGNEGPCGVRVETPSSDIIFYDNSASVHHQRHILTHELMHVYMDHPGSLELDTPAVRAIGVNPSLVMRMSGRTSYSSADEREAETLASVVRYRMYRERESPSRQPTTGASSWEALFAQPFMRGRRRCW